MLRPITGGAADAAPDSPAPDSFTPSTSRDLIGRRVTVRTVSDPALSGEPAPSEHTHPAMFMRGRGFIPLIGDAR